MAAINEIANFFPSATSVVQSFVAVSTQPPHATIGTTTWPSWATAAADFFNSYAYLFDVHHRAYTIGALVLFVLVMRYLGGAWLVRRCAKAVFVTFVYFLFLFYFIKMGIKMGISGFSFFNRRHSKVKRSLKMKLLCGGDLEVTEHRTFPPKRIHFENDAVNEMHSSAMAPHHMYAPTGSPSELSGGRESHDSTFAVGVSKYREVEAAFKKIMDEYKVPGCIASFKFGDSHSHALKMSIGVANLGMRADGETAADAAANNYRNMETNMFFRIGSVTKSMTATLMLILVAKRYLTLHDPISKWANILPVFKNMNKITILQLLNMTSGLADYEDSHTFDGILQLDPLINWDYNDLLRWAADQEPNFEPGTSWKYCNTGYVICGLIIAHITQMTAAEAFKRFLFDPLGMTHSHLATDNQIPAPHPHGYGDFRNKFEDCTYWNPRWGYTAGAVISTLDDMQKWAHAMGTGTLLKEWRKPASQVLLDSSSTLSSKAFIPHTFFYGLGVVVDGQWVWHNGSLPGAQSICAYLPNHNITVVISINQSDLPSYAKGGHETVVTQLFRRFTEICTPAFPLHR